MSKLVKYRCPVCKKPLTKKEFQRALHIHKAQEEHLAERERQQDERDRQFKTKEKQIKDDARASERARNNRIIGNQGEKIRNLQQTIQLLKRGKTPQEGGPEFEIKLVRRLKDEFESLSLIHI